MTKKKISNLKSQISNPFTPAERQAWRTQTGMTVSQWAQKYRVIPKPAAEHGPWRNDRVPYLVDVMDAFSDPFVQEITICGPGQCGKTEVVFNMIGYSIDCSPVPMLYVIATDDMRDEISQDRLLPIFEQTPQLARHLTGRPRDIRKGKVFRFDSMPLYFAGSQSAPALCSRPIGRIICDETDKYPAFVGKEGAPTSLAKRRTTTFPDSKAVFLCTLTMTDGFIFVSYNRSNMQRYFLPCPLCGEYQDMEFGRLRVEPPELRDPEVIIDTECVYYICKVCEKRIESRYKTDMVAAGRWCPQGQSVDRKGNLVGRPIRGRRHSGFWIDGLISPWLHWPNMMAEFFEKIAQKNVLPGELREFKNQVLAQVWVEEGKKIEKESLVVLKGGFSRGTVPDGCLILVAAADYHKSEDRGIVRIDYEVRGFGYEMRNWVISTGSVDSFDALDDQVLMSPFPWADGTPNEKRPWPAVSCLFVDSGYKPDDVYEYCQRRPSLTIATKGMESQATPLQVKDLDRATAKRLSSKKRFALRTMQLIDINTAYFKEQVTGWVEPARNDKGEIVAPPRTEFYAEIPDYYLTEFCNEQKRQVVSRGGFHKWVWEPIVRGAPTHSLDTAVLCAAAAFFKGVQFMRRPGEQPVRSAAMGMRKKIRLSEIQRAKRPR